MKKNFRINKLVLLVQLLIGFLTLSNTKGQVKPVNAGVPIPVITPFQPSAHTVIPKNFIKTWEVIKPLKTESEVVLAGADESLVQVQYFDDLGRPLQTIKRQYSPLDGNGHAHDEISSFVYDSYGKESKKFLPYASSQISGDFILNPYAEQATSLAGMYPGEQFFYKQDDYERSPLNRVLGSSSAGNSWTGSMKGKATDFKLSANEEVLLWNATFDLSILPYSTGFYGSKLLKDITSDEDGKRIIVYKDSDGRKILTKVENVAGANPASHIGWLCTYYIYDNMGRLQLVIPPKAVSLLPVQNGTINLSDYPAIFNGLCYYSRYDAKNRLIIQKSPGGREVWNVYDKKNRKVMTQDGTGKWTIYKYDKRDRITAVYERNDSQPRSFHEQQAWNLDSYPDVSSTDKLLLENYYDNYSAASTLSLSGSMVTAQTQTGFHTPSDVLAPFPQKIQATDMVDGRLTIKRVNILGTNQYLYTCYFYDEKGRVVQELISNISGATDIVTNQYSFSGKLLVSKYSHTATGMTPGAVTVITKNEYDHAGRLLTTKKKVNEAPEVVIVKAIYDKLGKLWKKELGQEKTGGSYTDKPIETLTYDYNVKGWLSGINKDYVSSSATDHYFGEKISYDYGFNVPGSGYLNGNIAGKQWKTYNDNEQRAYGYKYDFNNRLLSADFTQLNGGTWSQLSGHDYTTLLGNSGNDDGTGYDLNGNIKKLKHKSGGTFIDDLEYGYDLNSDVSNKLYYVRDNNFTPAGSGSDFKEISQNYSQDYWYDNNGNLTKDLNKGISTITYNRLNKPEVITVSGKGVITFTYDAEGNRLKKQIVDYTNGNAVKSYSYLGGFYYEDNDLKEFIHEEGRVRRKPDGNYVYDYYVKDYQGNVRVTLTEETTVQQYRVATMEVDSAAEEEAYYANIEMTRAPKPMTYPDHDQSNKYVSKLDGKRNKVGPSILLKVMAGDELNFGVQSWGEPLMQTVKRRPETLATQALSLLDRGGAGLFPPPVHNVGAGLPSGNVLPALTSMLSAHHKSSEPLEGRSKAYINWILLDENLQPFKDMDSLQLFKRTEYAGFQYAGGSGELRQHVKEGWKIPKSGYALIYTSNESEDQVVTFDNLRVNTISSRILQVDHYYPFGLKIDGISTSAFGKLENKFRYNGKRLDDKEFSDGTGLHWYDYGGREYDVQVGRFMRNDPLSEKFYEMSTYQYAANNPIRNIDFLGLAPVTTYQPYDWIRLADGNRIYNSRVLDQDRASTIYGSDATHIVNGSTESKYFLNDGSEVTLYSNGTYAINGVVETARDAYNDAIKDSWDTDNNGMLSLSEANNWYRNAGGQPISVDASKVKIGRVPLKHFVVGEQNKRNLLWDFNSPGLVYGTLDYKYEGNNQFSIYTNAYDFDIGASQGHPWFRSGGGFVRNVLTYAGARYADFWGLAGTGYDIHFDGFATAVPWGLQNQTSSTMKFGPYL